MEELFERTVEIKNSHVRVVELPFNEPVHLPFAKIETRPSVWVEIEADIDTVTSRGAAEGSSLPVQIPLYDDYSGNLLDNTTRIIDEIGTSKKDLAGIIETIRTIDLNGNFATARMSVEAALIDTIARSDNTSVASYLDGKPSQHDRRIPYGKSIAESSRDKILEAAEEAMRNGAKRLKFKLSPTNFNALYPALKEVMNHYPDVDCMVDANGMFDPEDPEHICMLGLIDDLHLLTIEEPVSRAGKAKGLVAHRALASAMKFTTPITIDDAVKSSQDARFAIDEQLAQVVNLKPGRVGSFIECVRIAEYAKTRDAEVMVGGMFEATPGRMMTLSLAAYCLAQGFRIPGDVSLPQERLSADLTSPVLRLDENSNVVFKPIAGWGYEL